MATSESSERQTRFGDDFGTLDYQRGDLLEPTPARNGSVMLSECPLCASDPTRPRYHFRASETRPEHFRDAHGPGDV